MSRAIIKSSAKEGNIPDPNLKSQTNPNTKGSAVKQSTPTRGLNDSGNKNSGSKIDLALDSFSDQSKQFDLESNPEENRKTPNDLKDEQDEKGQDNTSSMQTGRRKTSSLRLIDPQGAKSKPGTTLNKPEANAQKDLGSPQLKKGPQNATNMGAKGQNPRLQAVNNQTKTSSAQPSPMKTQSPGTADSNAGKSSTGMATAVVAFAKDFAANKVKTSNVKVVARFRPMNKMEQELTETGVGSECVSFPSDQEVEIKPDNQRFTLDRIFRPDSTQIEIYEFLGRETIDDVLNGYNGTIFAYGQTGSGKTHTMYGNIHDPDLKGVIPRASQHIFEYIDGLKLEIDLYIKCSMLEIYKENLYDLLIGFDGQSAEKTPDLKIKENPRRGIYVEGLIQDDVESTEELIDLLSYGDKQRTVAATRMNNYSSRSHSLFIMEIIQKFPSEAEKRGRLNLVDLAGSEKVGKTGVSGETLEEAKKINLSLSCLGNVIKALTANQEHIPYRDSKLTRILQESLGGNYKTSLIVAGSPHSSNKEETITTMKFAARAKTIKNRYKMNIQNSPEALMAVIESLKADLEDCRNELTKYKEGGFQLPGILGGVPGGDPFQRNWSRFRANNPLDPEHTESHYEEFKNQVQLEVFDPMKNMEKIREERLKNKEGDGENQELDNIERSEIVAKVLSMKLEENRSLYQKKDYHSYSYYKTNLELLSLNENLERRFNVLSTEYAHAKREIADRDKKIKEQEEEIRHMRSQILNYETKINYLTSENSMMHLKISTKADNLETQKLTIEVLEKQIYAINEALNNDQASIESLLSQKSRLVSGKFQEFINDDINFKEIKLPEYFKHSYNFNFEPFYNQIPQSVVLNPDYNENKNGAGASLKNLEDPRLNSSESSPKKLMGEDQERDEEQDYIYESNVFDDQNKKSVAKDSFISNIDLQNAFSNASNNLRELLEIPYNVYSLLNKLQDRINEESKGEKTPSSEFLVYLLKQELLQACIINQHLERTIAALEWKQIIEYGKAKIKSNHMKMQERHIRNLEKVLEKAKISHEHLRNKVEVVELESIKLRESLLNIGPGGANLIDTPKPSGNKTSKVRIMKSIRSEGRKATRFHGPENTLQREKTVAVQNHNETPSSQQRIHTETESHELSDTKKDNKTLVSFAGYPPISKTQLDGRTNEGLSSFLKEIDEENQASNANPTSLEESKALLTLKNNIINKMRAYIVHLGMNKDSGYTDENQNVIQYLKYENERLENKLLLLRTELDAQDSRAEQIKDAFNEQKKQMAKLSHLNTEIEIACRNGLKKENESWQKILDEMKSTHHKEIQRKQEEVTKLHDLLAGWVFRYMELQESRGIMPTHPEKMLYEAFKRKEIPLKSLLEKALTVSRSSAQLTNNASAFQTARGNNETPRKIRIDLRLDLQNTNNYKQSNHSRYASTSRSKKSQKDTLY